MTLDNYQQAAMTTCMPSCENAGYMLINLVGELGELSSKIAKLIRKGQANFYDNHLHLNTQAIDSLPELRKEAGDCLWQLAGFCKVMGWTLEEVAQENLAKLHSRQERNCIDGEGDNR